MQKTNPSLPFHICLAGPTAAGKTAAALAIAHLHAVEIISVDSALVFKGMDLGTAKPSAAELQAVPHHLINIRDPLHAYSAAEFVQDAQGLICDISARGKIPLLVGGTMLYFKALFDGIDPMPCASPSIRAAIEQQARSLGWPALHAQLAAIDPITAARLAPADSQRIQRALEVYQVSGLPMSHFQKGRNTDPSSNGMTLKALSAPLIALEPLDRAWLHTRIAQRFDHMLAHGLLDEVKKLRARGDLHRDLPSMRCVGYRQTWEALDQCTELTELRDRGIFATRQLAKRQITWLRSMPQRQAVACDAPDALDQVVHVVSDLIRQR